MNTEFETNYAPEAALESAPKKKIWPVVLAAIIGIIVGAIVTAAVSIFVITRQKANLDNSSKDVIESITGETDSESINLGNLGDSNNKLETLLYIIKNYYYQDVDNSALIEGVYHGLVTSLDDPYSSYYTAEEYEDLLQTITGNYAGIGALLQKNIETGEVTITKVYADTPAEKSGLLAGDSIVSADEYLAVDEDLDAFVQHIRGDEGTDVELLINRDGEELTVTCTRALVSAPTVEHQMLQGNVGYIAVSQFTESTYDDFVEAYEDLESQGMTSVVFDMRNNGGGLVDSVVEILDYLLPEGTVVYTLDKYDNKEEFTSDEKTHKDLPCVVLVNENTASAAEIFTGAVRDFEYGTIIGTNTFGKGIVQSTIPLNDGSAVKLTTQTYYTPSGESIHGKGIAPDMELEYEFLGGENDTYSVDFDNQIQKALEVLAGN